VIAGAVKTGLLDTPHFQGNPNLCGNITTRLIDGAWYAIERETGEKLTEKERIKRLQADQ